MFDALHGWLSPDDGSIYQTTDGGATWCEDAPLATIHSQFSAIPSYFVSLTFRSESLGWGAEISGRLLETHDGGHRWLRVSAPRLQFEQVSFSGLSGGWAVAKNGLDRLEVR